MLQVITCVIVVYMTADDQIRRIADMIQPTTKFILHNDSLLKIYQDNL